jgi:Uma2 family endonuclease
LRMPNNSAMELVDGQIVEKHVSMESSDVELEIGSRFREFLRGKRIGRAFPASLGYQCFQSLPHDPDRVRKPDCTVVRAERLATLDNPDPGYMPIIPDLAVEVVSPNDTAREIAVKLREYRAAGFPLVWVVEPDQRIVTVYPNPGKPYTLSEDDEIRAESALPGFVCKVSDLFPPTLALPEL